MEKPEQNGVFKVWTDGSALNNGRHMGAGWVIYEGDRKVGAYSHPVMEPLRGSSMLAEINAAMMALTSIPRDSVVKLHSDCQAVLDYLETGSTGSLATKKSKHKESMMDAITHLFNAAARHKAISLVKTDDKSDKRLKEAHHLAQEGAEKARHLKNIHKKKPSCQTWP